MKKLAYIVLSVVMTTSIAKASWYDKVIDYGLPCLVGFGLGSLADGNNTKLAIGSAVCGSTSLSTWLNQRQDKKEMIDEDFKKFVKLMDEKADEKNLQMQKQQDAELLALKQLMKDVMAERIANMEIEMKSDMKKYIENNEFMKDVEIKLNAKIKDNVVQESKARQKETINQCIDEALSKLVKKKYGTPKDEVVE